MTTFTDYLTTNRTTKIKADINERWEKRILAKGLNELGQKGAGDYLEQYGKGILPAKVIQFALKAELEKYPEMALGFWLKAYELETGLKADPSEYKAP